MAQKLITVHVAEPGVRIKPHSEVIYSKRQSGDLHCVKGSRLHIAKRHVSLLQHLLNLSCIKQLKVRKDISLFKSSIKVAAAPEVMTQSTSRVSGSFM